MALCPFAVVRLLHPEAEQASRITPQQLILHTAVSPASSLYGYFARTDVNTESHFYIAADGTLEQYVDTERRADAQFDGNLHGVSVETWDNADPSHVALTHAQVATFVRLARWLHETHSVPLSRCTGPQAPGLGYHSLFHEWAKDGHTCPNALRIGQFNNEILPQLAGAGDDDMTDAQAKMLEGIHADVWTLTAKVDQLAAAVAALPKSAGTANAVALTDADVLRISKAVIAEIAS